MISRPTIFIAMPLFQGWQHVAQTLVSIQRQTYGNYRVLISVDGGDLRSHETCEPFLSDRRFDIVLQQDRLGWERNINYLADRLNEDFFCYWQHDDHCDPSYLETLTSHAVAHPEASAIYCDMKVYGEVDRIICQPSVTGFALERVLAQVSKPNVPAIRCLIRADALRASIPIKFAGAWVLSLARAGELHRVPELLYFRRSRPNALSYTMPQEPPEVMWRASLDWGMAVLKNVHPLIGEEEQTKLFAMIVTRIMDNDVKAKLQFNFSDTSRDLKIKFVRQFLDEAASKHGWRPYSTIPDDERSQELRKRRDSKEPLPVGEALLIDAILARDLLSDDAIVKEHVPLALKHTAKKVKSKSDGGALRKMVRLAKGIGGN